MTVADLIAHLKTLPPDALVYTRGHEGGLNDPAPPRPVTVVRNFEWDPDRWYYGPHLETGHLDQYGTQAEGTEPVGYLIDGAPTRPPTEAGQP